MIIGKYQNDARFGEILTLEGDTYPARLDIKRLGFTWNGLNKFWWISKPKVDDNLIFSLKKIGVTFKEDQNVSAVNSTTKEESATKEVTNKTDFDEFSNGYEKNPGVKYMGFPVKKNIYSTEFKLQENDDKIRVVVDRSFEKGVRGIPKYVFNLFYLENFIGPISVVSPGKWVSGKPLFDEDSFVLNHIKNVSEMMFNKEKPTKALQRYYMFKRLEARDPEFASFLKFMSDNAFYSEKKEEKEELYNQKVPYRKINIEEGEYSGEYLIKHEIYSNVLDFKTGVENDLAPRPKSLGSLKIVSTIQNFEQLNSAIDSYIQENLEEIKKEYLEYLKSYPHSEAQQEQSKNEMREIVGLINNVFDVDFFRNKLISKGFIRPSRKMKNQVGGMVPQESISYVIDDSKIRDAVYSSKNANRPDYLFDVLAYFLMRKARNITSFTEMMLVTNMQTWTGLAKKYGYDIPLRDIDAYLEKIVKLLYKDLTGNEAPKSRMDQYSDFYSGFKNEEAKNVEHLKEDALKPFVDFAVKNGITEEEARQYPKKVYRQLAFKLHPDRNQGNTVLEEELKKLNNLYENIPDNMKMASGWYAVSCSFLKTSIN